MDEIEDDKYEVPVFTCPEWGHRLILRVTKLEADNKRLRVEMDLFKKILDVKVEQAEDGRWWIESRFCWNRLTEEEAAVLKNKE